MNDSNHELLAGCENQYTKEKLYDRFGTVEYELKKCMRCVNFVNDNGMQSCKYFYTLNNLTI